ncbi:replicative DNA helicase [bacterium]|jgi:replicative DNA helicase|nr:replicative DNA helicase [bacterium]
MATSNGKSRRRPQPTENLFPQGLPPQNLDAERMLLGCVLRDNMVINDLVRLLKSDYFYSDKHQKIFKAMTDLSELGVPIDPVTLGEQLNKSGVLVEIGGAPTIVELYQQTLTAANWRHYSDVVYQKAIVRNLIRISNDILRDAYEGVSSSDDLLQDAERKIMDIASNRSTGETVDIGTALQAAFARLSDRQTRDGAWTTGVPTGFTDLDQLTNGFQESELIILAARPSMGKTSLAMNFAEHAAVDHKCPVLFVSLEMSMLELAERLLCSRAGVNLQFVRKGRLSKEDTMRLIQTGDELGSAPIYIDDQPGQTMMRIAGTARRIKMQYGLRMIVIDYLQLIESEDRNASRQEQISTISRRLKTLARDLKVPIISLSQLNRSAEQREGHRPRMSDLRESGSIEQDADVVMLLHRDDAYDSSNNPNTADLIIAKQRNGPIGDIRMTFLKELTRFTNYAPNIPSIDMGGPVDF